ncbi:MAG: NAD(P)/FAD-dependent oxidoreductase [Stenotrophomonas sp.]
MDLKSGYPFWAIRNGLMQAFPRLERDLHCEVVVIGGGITGALIGERLGRHGHEVVVVEQRDIGWGSTAASTALLQYEIDTPMSELARRFGLEAALQAYRACAEAVSELGELAGQVRNVDFQRAGSLYYASRRRDLGPLIDEFELRQRHGLAVHWLDAAGVRERFGFTAPGAILSDVAARIDPYRMTYRLLRRLQRAGGRVHDRTRIDGIEVHPRSVLLRTSDGVSVRCRQVVVAAGYASQHWLTHKVASNRSSYAYVTDPLPRDMLGPLASTLVWETARPYLYLRSTADQRLLVGGDDDAVDIPARRDARVDRKARGLAGKVAALFPHLQAPPAFAWAGTFAETDDGLPFFGPHPQWGPRVHFAMAYGGNGITYSMTGAAIVQAAIERRKHPLAALYAFQRRERGRGG